MIVIHPKKFRLIENIISIILLLSIPLLVFILDSERKLTIKNSTDFVSFAFLILIFIFLIYRVFNPNFLSFEKSIFENRTLNKDYELESNIFILADYKIEQKDNIITLSRFGKKFNITKTIINLNSKTLLHQPFGLINIKTLIKLEEIENFDVVFRPNKRNVLIYETKFNKKFELKTLILNPLSLKNKYPERKEQAMNLVNYLNSLLKNP